MKNDSSKRDSRPDYVMGSRNNLLFRLHQLFDGWECRSLLHIFAIFCEKFPRRIKEIFLCTCRDRGAPREKQKIRENLTERKVGEKLINKARREMSQLSLWTVASFGHFKNVSDSRIIRKRDLMIPWRYSDFTRAMLISRLWNFSRYKLRSESTKVSNSRESNQWWRHLETRACCKLFQKIISATKVATLIRRSRVIRRQSTKAFVVWFDRW